MEQFHEFHVGEVVYLLSADTRDGLLKTATVSKVGYKYITVKYFNMSFQFDINYPYSQKNTGYGCGYDWILYFSKEAYQKMLENERKRKAIVKFFQYNSVKNIPAEKIEKIYDLIEPYREEWMK